MPPRPTRSRRRGDPSPGWGYKLLWLLVGAAVMIIAAGVLGLGSTGGVGGASGSVFSTGGVDAATPHTLYLSVDDANFMNRVFRELDHEIAYCGLITGGQRISPHLADTITATETELRFSTANCPDSGYHEVGLIHTHPNGNPGLSSTDRRTFRQSSLDYTCVQSGKITVEAGSRTQQFRCYAVQTVDGSPDRFVQVPIQITE